jgi:hypothetical protein
MRFHAAIAWFQVNALILFVFSASSSKETTKFPHAEKPLRALTDHLP